MTTHYQILGIPKALQDDPTLSGQTIRSAYRRALLQHHPDKSKSQSPNTLKSTETETYTIDQISHAFSTLSNPKRKTEYDNELKILAVTANREHGEKDVFRTGVEVVDLDEMQVDEAQNTWYRSCRCGDDRGFLVREEDLEEAVDEGEISVGCRGCSLWLKVLFGVMDDDSVGAGGEAQHPSTATESA
ncbi:hypothetical protein BP6252_05201 [Coleophoma cylindrospora]|uniref:Diphthamide biosynthesis protein 4 n=1 Tax=Coleophoma cylindrospora TaxID=1849047 RepID=A0A3D8RT57_9HELO|nr:hypothetical protein BP6252_05201 [Coleophoma cylindrospora]